MKIDDNVLIRFINNDLSKSERYKIQLLINNNRTRFNAVRRKLVAWSLVVGIVFVSPIPCLVA